MSIAESMAMAALTVACGLAYGLCRVRARNADLVADNARLAGLVDELRQANIGRAETIVELARANDELTQRLARLRRTTVLMPFTRVLWLRSPSSPRDRVALN